MLFYLPENEQRKFTIRPPLSTKFRKNLNLGKGFSLPLVGYEGYLREFRLT